MGKRKQKTRWCSLDISVDVDADGLQWSQAEHQVREYYAVSWWFAGLSHCLRFRFRLSNHHALLCRLPHLLRVLLVWQALLCQDQVEELGEVLLLQGLRGKQL